MFKKSFQDYYPESLSHCYGCGTKNAPMVCMSAAFGTAMSQSPPFTQKSIIWPFPVTSMVAKGRGIPVRMPDRLREGGGE
jgi:hypothetical protein